jgi:hypothetical protein
MENKRQQLELADILMAQAPSFLKGQKLCEVQKKAYHAIINCRTSKLGGHIQECNACKQTKNAYNSCRNRHCPKCQFIKKVKWVDKLSGNLPPVKYFHLVFTVPESLNKLFYLNQKEAYSILFKASGKALTQCAKNTKYLGANAGGVGILHTWGQSLVYHPHVHMIVPAGGLSEDATEWIPSHKKFFLSVKILSAVFRGIMTDMMKKSFEKGNLKLPDGIDDFEQIKHLCYKKKWVVYSEKPFASPKNLINYLGNYTHRVAISNKRLIKHQDGKVSFYYKDYKKAGIRRVMTLDEDEFTRRFMQHILPSGFSKIRYFGFLSLRNLQENIQQCCNILEEVIFLPELDGLNGYEVFRAVMNIDPLQCNRCKKGRMIVKQTIKAPS